MMSPTPLSPRFDTIPPELHRLPWVLWRAEPRGDDKPAKVPYRVAEPLSRASSTDPATWASFEDAVEAFAALAESPADARRGAVAGIGVVLTRGSDITCIDLDHVIAPDGHLDDRAATIVDRCDSWTEISPSGRGLHIFVRGSLPRALKGPQIEVYSDGRYICVTGHIWPGTPNVLRSQQAYLEHIARLEKQGHAPRPRYTGPVIPAPDDLAGALLAKLQGWGVPVSRLRRWSGGFLVELIECPWADDHTTGRGGAAVMIRASGAFDFTCLHAHCAGRSWREFRAAKEQRS